MCRIALLILAVVLTAALLRPEPALASRELLPPDAEYPAAKAVHITAYALLVLLLALSRWPREVTWLGLGLISLHAAWTEVGQTFVPGRYGSLRDVGFDHVGILIGLALAWLLCWRRR